MATIKNIKFGKVQDTRKNNFKAFRNPKSRKSTSETLLAHFSISDNRHTSKKSITARRRHSQK